ncbi:MAG: hypothetical protein ABIT69_01190 [Sphingomicrobium sp.]
MAEAPNQTSFTLKSKEAHHHLRANAPSMLPSFGRTRRPIVMPGPDGLTGPERLAVTGKREAGE